MWSQEDILIGKEYSIYSDILQEERKYWVHLPDCYSTSDKNNYSVIYLLDGELFFHSVVGMSKTISSGKDQYLPKSIIVGIISKDRAKDMTPSASTIGRGGQINFFQTPQGGGSEHFYSFLINELRPLIESEYKTNGENILIGHSYSALFTFYTFLRHTEKFDKYIAIDPSLWWDGGKLIKESDSLIKNKKFKGKGLYIAVATKKRNDRIDIQTEIANELFYEILPKTKELLFITKFYPEESHGTIAIPGIYDGLKQLYKR